MFLLLPDLLPEGEAHAGQAGEGHEEDCSPQVDAVAGVRVGIVQPLQHPEAALCLAVVKVDGNGVAARLQGVQVGALQGDDILLQGEMLVVQLLAVNPDGGNVIGIGVDDEGRSRRS